MLLVERYFNRFTFSGNQAHSRSDRELHGKCLISPEAQMKFKAFKRNIQIKV
jgi:aconitase B